MVPAGLLVLRVALAFLLAAHAAHWLFGLFAGAALGPGGLTATTTYYANAGMPAPFFFVLLAGILLLGGSALLFVGWFTRYVAPLLVVILFVGISFDSARWGFFLNWALDPTRGHGSEYAFLQIAILICLALTGAGEWSLDGYRARTHESRVAGRARIRDHA